MLGSQTQHCLRWVSELWRGLCGEPDSEFPTLSHWAAERSVWRARLSISNTESLSCGVACVESQTQHFLRWVTVLWRGCCGKLDTASYTLSLCVVYIAVCGRLSKSLLILWSKTQLLLHWVPLLFTYLRESQAQQILAEFVEQQLSKSLVSLWSSGSANPCWVGEAAAQQILAELVGAQLD